MSYTNDLKTNVERSKKFTPSNDENKGVNTSICKHNDNKKSLSPFQDTSVAVIPSLLWDGGLIWKIPYKHNTKMVLRKVTIKRANKTEEFNRCGIKVSVVDSDGNAIAPFNPKYIAKPPTIEWYTVNEDEPTSTAITKSGELVLDSLATLSLGHNSAAFQSFLDHKGIVPLEEMCFSINSGGQNDSDKLDNRSPHSSHNWIGSRTLDFVARSLPEARRWSNAFSTVIKLAKNEKTLSTSKCDQLCSIDLETAADSTNIPLQPTNNLDLEIVRSVYTNNYNDAIKLIESGACVDTCEAGTNETPLIIACRLGFTRVVDVLLKYGAKIDPFPDHYPCALIICVQNRQLESAAIVLSHASSSALCQRIAYEVGEIALHEAAALEDLPMMDLLLRYGADSSRLNENGASILHVAAANGSNKVLKALLEHGFDAIIESADDEGNTPLHLATAGGHLKCVSLLLAAGACADVRNFLNRQSPLMIANVHGHVQIARLLKEYTVLPTEAYKRATPRRRVPTPVIPGNANHDSSLSNLNRLWSWKEVPTPNRSTVKSASKRKCASMPVHMPTMSRSARDVTPKTPVITSLIDYCQVERSQDVMKAIEGKETASFICFDRVWTLQHKQSGLSYYWCPDLEHGQWEDPRVHGMLESIISKQILDGSIACKGVCGDDSASLTSDLFSESIKSLDSRLWSQSVISNTSQATYSGGAAGACAGKPPLMVTGTGAAPNVLTWSFGPSSHTIVPAQNRKPLAIHATSGMSRSTAVVHSDSAFKSIPAGIAAQEPHAQSKLVATSKESLIVDSTREKYIPNADTPDEFLHDPTPPLIHNSTSPQQFHGTNENIRISRCNITVADDNLSVTSDLVGSAIKLPSNNLLSKKHLTTQTQRAINDDLHNTCKFHDSYPKTDNTAGDEDSKLSEPMGYQHESSLTSTAAQVSSSQHYSDTIAKADRFSMAYAVALSYVLSLLTVIAIALLFGPHGNLPASFNAPRLSRIMDIPLALHTPKPLPVALSDSFVYISPIHTHVHLQAIVPTPSLSTSSLGSLTPNQCMPMPSPHRRIVSQEFTLRPVDLTRESPMRHWGTAVLAQVRVHQCSINALPVEIASQKPQQTNGCNIPALASQVALQPTKATLAALVPAQIAKRPTNASYNKELVLARATHFKKRTNPFVEFVVSGMKKISDFIQRLTRQR